jgi:arylsulfatase A-like enzyme
MSNHIFALFPMASCVLAYLVAQKIAEHMDPFQQQIVMPDTLQDVYFRPLKAFFSGNMSASAGPTKKNLIILEVESLEVQVLGHYNADFKRSMPYFSNLSQKVTFCDHVKSSPYTTWSVASAFAVQCNLPLLMTPTARYNRASFHLLPEHVCLGEYFAKAGYHLHSWLANVFVGRFKNHMRLHHWPALDVEDHGIRRDWDLFELLERSLLPNLTRPSEQPFVLHVAHADNHAFPRYFVDPRCQDRVPEYPLIMRSFDCVDQIVGRFIEAVKKSPLANNTEIFVYADHLLMTGVHQYIRLFDPRHIVAMFPIGPKQIVSKPLTIYDFAPTLMDIIGIEYQPKFPFGASMFSPIPGTAPTTPHFQFIYNNFSRLMNWKDEARCTEGDSGFCRAT